MDPQRVRRHRQAPRDRRHDVADRRHDARLVVPAATPGARPRRAHRSGLRGRHLRAARREGTGARPLGHRALWFGCQHAARPLEDRVAERGVGGVQSCVTDSSGIDWCF